MYIYMGLCSHTHYNNRLLYKFTVVVPSLKKNMSSMEQIKYIIQEVCLELDQLKLSKKIK